MLEFKPLPCSKTASQVRHSLPAMQEMADSLNSHGQLQKPGVRGSAVDGPIDESASLTDRGAAVLCSAIDAALSTSVCDAAKTINHIFHSFRLSPPQLKKFGMQACAEVQRHLMKAAQRAPIDALWPVLQPQSVAYFMRHGVPNADAEELTDRVQDRLWRCIDRQGIQGNAGALVATIRFRLLCVYGRARRRRALRQASEIELRQLTAREDLTAEYEALEQKLDSLPNDLYAMAEQRRKGTSWPEVTTGFKTTPRKAKAAIQGAWPGGSPLPKRRLRNSKSARSTRANKSTSA